MRGAPAFNIQAVDAKALDPFRWIFFSALPLSALLYFSGSELEIDVGVLGLLLRG